MFADFALARRIEAAEANLSREIGEATAQRPDAAGAPFVRPLAGGVAVFAGPDSPISKVIGVGFDGMPSERDVQDMERAFFERKAPVRAEVSTLADPALCATLTGRGYILAGFENVLGRRLDETTYPEIAGVAVGQTSDASTWNEVVIGGFAHPDTGVAPAPPGEEFPREVLERIYDDMARAGGFSRYLATIDGKAVGGASLRLCAGIALLAGAATLPPYRHRGVQTALLTARLQDAARAGCEIAVVTTQPGSKSQQNVQRRGFALLYARAVLVSQPPVDP